MKKGYKTLIYAVLLSPVFVYANTAPTTFKGLVNQFLGYLNSIIPILAMVAIGMFFFGIAQFIFNAGNSEVNADAKQKMFWGVIALFTIISLWGLIYFIGDSVGIREHF